MPLKLRKGVLKAETEYGIVLLDEETGEYWNLNHTAAAALRTLAAGGTTEEAARDLSFGYEVDLDSAAADVGELIAALRSANLVER
jgi:Coenzyme PQQ synthesis protein D (PqqD)